DGTLAQTLSSPEGPRCLALFEFVEGAPASFQNTDHAYLAGRAAARIHNAANAFTMSCPRPRLDLAALIDEPMAAIGPFLGAWPGARDYLEGFAARLRPRAKALLTDELDFGLVHGDYGHKNMLLNPAGDLTVLDFDHCALTWRAYDFTSVYGDA